MMKNFATKPAVKTVFLLAGICLALFMAVQWIFALGTPGPVSWAIVGMIAITLLTLFLGIIPPDQAQPGGWLRNCCSISGYRLNFCLQYSWVHLNRHLVLALRCPGLWPFMGEKIEQ